jgi:hypothetical protein
MKSKAPTRLNPPTMADRLWFNGSILKSPDCFQEPTLYSEYYKLKGGKAIYPIEPERISHQKAELIRKYGKPHHSIWLNRIDLFVLSIEGDDWERVFTCNLAGIDRAAHLRAQAITSERMPKDATVDGQVYWELVSVLASDTLHCTGGEVVFVSPLLHHLATGELEPLTPLRDGEPIFDRHNAPGLFMKEGDRRWMREQARFQEHNTLKNLHLDRYGFIKG